MYKDCSLVYRKVLHAATMDPMKKMLKLKTISKKMITATGYTRRKKLASCLRKRAESGSNIAKQ